MVGDAGDTGEDLPASVYSWKGPRRTADEASIFGEPSLRAQSLLEIVEETIWLSRPDVRTRCGQNRQLFRVWLATSGRREYASLNQLGLEGVFHFLGQLSPKAMRPNLPPVTELVAGLWVLRDDLQRSFDIDSEDGLTNLFWWYVFHGIAEYDLGPFVSDAQNFFLRQSEPELPQEHGEPSQRVTRLMAAFWRRRPDLQATFDLKTVLGCRSYVEWFHRHGRELPWHGGFLEELASSDATEDLAQPNLKHRRPMPAGYNLIGFARGEFGVGEEVRMAAATLRAAGIPCGIYNLNAPDAVRQNDRSVESMVSEDLRFATNVFCMPGRDMALLIARQGGELLEGRRNVGAWPWELEEWPADWRHVFGLVDEIWAASRFSYGAFCRDFPRKVKHLPMGVSVSATTGVGRAFFGLPMDRFLFLYSFDGASSLSRKNPIACIRSFKMAFPLGSEPVGLVLKSMRLPESDPLAQELLTEAGADSRIILMPGTMNRGLLLDLYRACDCFVSLHRSEGFGRSIAECMMLGKPVVVTGYSGNLDYTTPGSAALVDYRLTTVLAGEYPAGEGIVWAEPSQEHAAWWMRNLFEERDLREKITEQGRKLVTASYAVPNLGKKYKIIMGNK